MIKLLTIVNVLSFIIIAANKINATESIFSFLAYFVFFVEAIILFKNNKTKLRYKGLFFFICICMYFLIHSFTTSDHYEMYVFYLLSILFLINMDNDKVFSYGLLSVSICFALLSVILNTKTFIEALFSINSYNADFLGLTKNTNTNSVIGLLSFISSVYFYKLKPTFLTKALCCFSLIYIIACQSRNSLLFVGLFAMMLLIDKRTQKFNSLSILLVITSLVLGMFYILLITNFDIELFGKGNGSNARTTMILYSLSHFDITFFGLGRDYVSKIISDVSGYALHNGYLYTIYSFGISYVLLYAVFVCYFYKNLKNNLSRSFLLSIHVYYLFEPIIFFEVGISSTILFLIVLTGDRLLTNKLQLIKQNI